MAVSVFVAINAHASMYCGNDLITEGMTKLDVISKCGADLKGSGLGKYVWRRGQKRVPRLNVGGRGLAL